MMVQLDEQWIPGSRCKSDEFYMDQSRGSRWKSHKFVQNVCEETIQVAVNG